MAGLAATQLRPTPTGDTGLTAVEVTQRLQAFKAQGKLILPAVPVADVTRAIDSLQLPSSERSALERDVEAGRVQLAWLTLWDDQVEDGDVVHLEGAGLNRTVSIKRSQQTIAVPLAGSGGFRLTGIRDGGGGITVAMKANGRDVFLPVMVEGQTLAINLAP